MSCLRQQHKRTQTPSHKMPINGQSRIGSSLHRFGSVCVNRKLLETKNRKTRQRHRFMHRIGCAGQRERVREQNIHIDDESILIWDIFFAKIITCVEWRSTSHYFLFFSLPRRHVILSTRCWCDDDACWWYPLIVVWQNAFLFLSKSNSTSGHVIIGSDVQPIRVYVCDVLLALSGKKCRA